MPKRARGAMDASPRLLLQMTPFSPRAGAACRCRVCSVVTSGNIQTEETAGLRGGGGGGFRGVERSEKERQMEGREGLGEEAMQQQGGQTARQTGKTTADRPKD